MYNLAHDYIYNDQNEINIKECFDLLIKSSYELHHSLVLLCLLLVKKFGFNLQKIKEEIDTIADLKENYSSKICSEILFLELNEQSNFDKLYEYYRKIDFIYNVQLEIVLSSEILNLDSYKNNKYPKAKNISSEFYKGFAIE